MSKDRIQIDGVWYIKEDRPKVDFNAVEYKGRAYESKLYYFEVTKLKKDDTSYYDDVGIEFKDKRENPWKKSYFDTNEWLLGVLEDTEGYIDDAKKLMCNQGIAELKAVVDDLIEIGWLKR